MCEFWFEYNVGVKRGTDIPVNISDSLQTTIYIQALRTRTQILRNILRVPPSVALLQYDIGRYHRHRLPSCLLLLPSLSFFTPITGFGRRGYRVDTCRSELT
jgi:hypothetical protein